jgi:hypothetical protein
MNSAGKQKPKSPIPQYPDQKTKPPLIPDGLLFSFKYIDLNSNTKFETNKIEKGYIHSFLTRLQDLSKMKLSELIDPKMADQLHFHPIQWNETSEPKGFQKVPSKLKYDNAYQFYITKNKHGRVHGFTIGNTFFVVWIDPHHSLYK